MLNEPIKYIIWAIDPFEEEITFDPSAFEEFNHWTEAQDITVEPTYVYTPSEGTKLADVKNQISEIVTQSTVKTLPPKVLLELPYLSTRRIGAVIAHATFSGASVIAVSSHCRRGLKRMLFGSFAEGLLGMSPLPVLFLNQHPRPKHASSMKVLWATDFSKTSEFAFETFLKQIHGIFDDIILFHDLSLALEITRYLGQWYGVAVNTDEIIEAKRQWANGEATRWVDKIRHNGFKGKSIVESGRNVSTDILNAARENNVGSIAMASETGPFASLLFGSHAREVFKASQFPVWIYGPGFCELYKTPRKPSREERETPAEFLDFNGFSVVDFLGILASIAVLIPLSIGLIWIFLVLISAMFGAIAIFIPKILGIYDERAETQPDVQKSPLRRLRHKIRKTHTNWRGKQPKRKSVRHQPSPPI